MGKGAMGNLFDLAPREMTNSAVWAWLLHGLQDTSDTPRKRIATRLMEKIGVPVPDVIDSIETERILPNCCRLDVCMEGMVGRQRFIMFFENKMRYDSNADSQVAGYCEALQNEGYELYPVLLSSFSGREILAKISRQWQPICLNLEEMIELVATEAHPYGTILSEFHDHLSRRLDRTRRAQTAFSRGNADPDMWLAVARENGVEELFTEYLSLAEAAGCSKIDFNQVRSVVVKYAHTPGLSGNPVLLVYLKMSSLTCGLRIGYNHVNWEKAFDLVFAKECLPADFADEPAKQENQPNWHIGFVRTSNELRRIFEAVRS